MRRGCTVGFLALLISCFANETALGPQPPTETVPVGPRDMLRRMADIEVVGSSFEDGLSAAETLEVFSREYDLEPSETEPVAYAVEIVASDETRLRPGDTVRMVHVAGVRHEVRGPTPQPGTDPSPPHVIEADVFAFFEAQTGTHLVTVYVGPPADA